MFIFFSLGGTSVALQADTSVTGKTNASGGGTVNTDNL